jgi:hypothetical protein
MGGPVSRIAQKQAKAHPVDDTGKGVKKITRAGKEPKDRLWSFSFRYWTQLDNFGLKGEGIDMPWVVSVLERLKQLSADYVETVLKNHAMKGQLRFHAIDWQARNIPIEQRDIPGLPAHYVDNPEFALHQFQVSTGKGRVVGFFDENWIFNVVLLDPLHNLQPSKNFDYAVNPCWPLSCELTGLREGIKQRIAQCHANGCVAAKQVSDLAHNHDQHVEQFEILMVKVTDQGQLQWAKNLVAEGKVETLADIFEAGLISIDDETGPEQSSRD